MKEIYIELHNQEEMKKEVFANFISQWAFDFPNMALRRGAKEGGAAFEYGKSLFEWDRVKKLFHGNSKILLHCFYNDITKKYEMQYTTRSIEKSYPGSKKLKIYQPGEVNFFTMVAVFGRVCPDFTTI